ncbi:hypothetical protein VKT23_009996 [Stygiomarasmius scandens]|uniref:Mid2 domain-containing protein n=1 Tax=Marasmiellus scandens TaxID=2682957 RepID=A0ABR1JFH2_9AGAR
MIPSVDQALNVFIGACNEQIDLATSGGSTIFPLSSLSISFSTEVNTATISVSTTLLRVTDNPANVINDLVSPTITGIETISTSSSNASVTTSTFISSTATEPAPTQDTGISDNHKTHNTGAIVGGVSGVASVLVITAALTLLYRRRKKRGRIVDHDENLDPQLVPYDHKYVSVHADPTPAGSALLPEAPESASVPLPPEKAGSVSTNNSPTFHNTTPGLSTSTEPFSHRPRSRAFSESSLTRIPSNTSRAGSDTNLTVRQLNIRSEADELRTQLQTMQREMVLSNDDVKNTLAMIMAHIQRLDSQFSSDWARGLTNEPPPEYGSR